MLTRDEFVRFVLEGDLAAEPDGLAANDFQDALPEGFEGFDNPASDPTHDGRIHESFARRLLEASGFGSAQFLERSEVILGNNPALEHLSDRVYYWPKSDSRPFQTLLFDVGRMTGTELLRANTFKKLNKQEILEDALSRFVQDTLEGFGHGGDKRTASVRQGRQDETLCVISVADDRERERKPTNLVCFGTRTTKFDSLETFHIREEARFWEPQLADEYLGLLYKRHFSRLNGERWQNAFITGQERRLAQELLEVCTGSRDERTIQSGVVALLEEIARGFGLRRKPGADTRLTGFALPGDHDIGVDAEENERMVANPFKGFSVRDERNRLLGYIIYCLDEKKDADELRGYLAKRNRFHNVLVIYPDGNQAVLELWQGTKKLGGKLRKSGATFVGESEVVNLLSRFFVVSRAHVRNPSELAAELAYRAAYLRRLALRQLREGGEKSELRVLYRAFKTGLIQDQTEEEFADAFAQTITYCLLAARWVAKDELAQKRMRFSRSTAREYLPHSSPFLTDLFETFLKIDLKSAESRAELVWLVEDIAALLDRVDISAVFGEGDSEGDWATDPVIHFYEPFLEAYDRDLKNKRGVYFTPRPVVSFIVRSIHDMLVSDFEIEDGIASTITWGELAKKNAEFEVPEGVDPNREFVRILDPAVGTGTFLFECVEVIEKTMKEKWLRQDPAATEDSPSVKKQWSAYVSEHLLPRLYGFELLMAPYTIAHLKLALKLAETGYKLGPEERLNVYLTDSLAPVSQSADPTLADLFTVLATEARHVSDVKRDTRFTVVLGNPPYLREKERGPDPRTERIGGWIRYGDSTSGRPLFDDFLDPLSAAGQGVHAKLAYEMSVMFWRLALWLVFEKTAGPGVVGMISPRAYIAGPGHLGMREWMKKQSSHVRILDLGGDNRGARKSENVFDIETGVAIGICSRLPGSSSRTSRACYREVVGNRDQKLRALEGHRQISEADWMNSAVGDSFLPSGSSDYSKWPELTNIFPWQHSGSQFKRLWPIGETRGLLERRWQRLMDLSSGERTAAFVETRDRRASSGSSKKYTGIAELPRNTPPPEIRRYCYRSLDHQWCFADERLADFIRPPLLGSMGGDQLFAATLMSKPLGQGPAVSVTDCLPDMDVFCNRGAKDVIPLWRDSLSQVPNINQRLLGVIQADMGIRVSPIDLFCYCVALLATPKFTAEFARELAAPGVRIPITTSPDLFRKTKEMGAQVIWLHTFGKASLGTADCVVSGKTLEGKAFLESKIGASGDYPADFSFDPSRCELRVGDGIVGGMEPAIFEYSLSGFRAVESWLRYRMAVRGGRARSAKSRSLLDEIRPREWAFTDELLSLLWTVEGCVHLWPEIDALFTEILAGETFSAEALPPPKLEETKAPKFEDAGQKGLFG